MNAYSQIMNRRRLWLVLALIVSLAANAVLLLGILYLRVPAVHSALYPVLRTIRGLPPAVSVPSPPTVVGPSQVRLALSEEKDVLDVQLPALADNGRYTVEFETGETRPLEVGEWSFTWNLHAGGSQGEGNLATIQIVSPSGAVSPVGEVEVFRVSEDEGLEQLGALYPDGLVFLGRCTFEILGDNGDTSVIREETVMLSALTQSQREEIRARWPDFVRDRSTYDSAESLVQAMSELLALTCSEGFRSFSAKNNAEIYSLAPADALDSILSGEIGVQCQGFRSAFLWLAISGGWLDARDVREVDLFRHAPVEGFIVNTHAVLEIRLPGQDWILFDPSSQAFFQDAAGDMLSAEGVRSLKRNDELSLVSVLPAGEFCISTTLPYYADREGGYWVVMDFSDRDPDKYNYWSHFELIVYRNLVLPIN